MMSRDEQRERGAASGLVVALVLLCLLAVPGCLDGDNESIGICQPVCENVMQCKEQAYADSDLASMTMESCLQWCAEFRADPGFEKAAECATSTTDCGKLDDECDVI